MPELMAGMGKWKRSLPEDPSKRSFSNLERQADGRFRDEDLARIMTETTEEVAGGYAHMLYLIYIYLMSI